MKYYFSYMLNRKLKKITERNLEGLAKGRQKALMIWFEDKWNELELVSNSIKSSFTQGIDEKELNEILINSQDKFKDFSEFAMLNSNGLIIGSSSSEQIGKNKGQNLVFKESIKKEKLMYGPYVDEDTLNIGRCNSQFFDRVTLMFSISIDIKGEKYLICGRIPNDVMSDIIQNEDTHIYKESGDNYLFMIDSNRNIQKGTAISRSRFEDNTFTDQKEKNNNLKDGIKTKKWGYVKIKEHTEFEIVFKNPATNMLHEGVQKTIDNGENLDAWPGYPEYRHIYVGGKGIVIKPPHSEETWGMLCEVDIEEIYKFRGLSLKIPLLFGISTATLMFIVLNIINNPILSYGIICFFNIFIVYFLIRRSIVKPLWNMTDILQKIAEGEGDLTLRTKKSSNDEIGEVSRWFNKFVNNQMEIIKHIKQETVNIKENSKVISKQMNRMSKSHVEQLKIKNELESGMEAIQKKMKCIMDNVGNQAASTQEMASSVMQITQKTLEVSKNAEVTQRLSTDAKKSAEEGEKLLDETIRAIVKLERDSQRIDDQLQNLNKISEQTKLLALNAAIEAARAGEAGKGFGVVADEVKNLSITSQEFTSTIAQLNSQMKESVRNNSILSNKVKDKIGEIKEKVAISNQEITNVSNAVNEKVAAMTDIEKGTQNLTVSSSAIEYKTVEQIDIIERANEILGVMSEIIEKNAASTKASTGGLLNISNKLSDMVKDFKTE